MESKYDSLSLKNQICFPLYLCSKEIIRKYTPYLNELDLTYTQYVVMMYFWEKQESNVKQISKILLIDTGTLTPLLKKLENKGYIERNKSLKDGRNLDVKVTKKGMNLRDKALQIPKKVWECLNLSENEIKDLYIILNKILNNLE